jgi:WD40 repeat protein
MTHSIVVDAYENVYVTGSAGSGYSDYVTIKYDSTGKQEWIARYDGAGYDNDMAEAIALDPHGNIYVTGRSIGSFHFYDFATVKYDPAGNELWVARYQGAPNADDEATSLAVDSLGNVYVAGGSSENGNIVFTTIKYSQNPATSEEHENTVTDYTLSPNYPNPFHAGTTIRFSIPIAGHVRLAMYDLLGREVALLVDDEVPSGSHTVRFDRRALPGGVYYYRIQTGDFIDTKRCVANN